MGMLRRKVAGIAVIVWMLVLVLGCSSNKGNKVGMEPSATQDPTASEAAKGKTEEERIKLSMFFGNIGIVAPKDFDYNGQENEIVRMVEEKAHVDLELEVPLYSEFKQKFDLLLASGKLPDLVFSYYPDVANKAGREGAFIDLRPYYDKSPELQKVITSQMMDLAKDPVSGKNFYIPSPYDNGPKGAGIMARYDLIEKYNNGKWPGTVEEWVELLRAIKKAEPASIPMTTRIRGDFVFGYGGMPFFRYYGADPYGYRIVNGKVIPNVVLPEFKEAVQLMRDLYKEGILDPEFATTTGTAYFSKLAEKNTLFQENGNDQILFWQASHTLPTALPAQKTQKWVFAPPLAKNPDILADRKYTIQGGPPPISGHGVYIPASAKNPDRAFKVIEAFAGDDIREAIYWGKENEMYTVNNGKRVPIVERMSQVEHTYKKQFSFVIGYSAGQDAANATYELQLGSELLKQIQGSMKVVEEEAMKNGLDVPPGYAEPDEVLVKNSEMYQAINKFTIGAIMGRISMEQLDAEIKAWEKKYRALKYDPLQGYIDANKNNLIKLGYIKAGW